MTTARMMFIQRAPFKMSGSPNSLPKIGSWVSFHIHATRNCTEKPRYAPMAATFVRSCEFGVSSMNKAR